MTYKEIKAMHRRLKKQGKTLDEMKAAVVAEERRRRDARIQAECQAEMHVATQEAQREKPESELPSNIWRTLPKTSDVLKGYRKERRRKPA